MCHSKLGEKVQAWKNINAPQYVIDWVVNGVPIPFSQPVPDFELDNHRLNYIQCAFIDKEIQRLLLSGYIEPCDSKPKCVSPIGCVPKRNKKYRLITDLRHLNSHCDVPKFRNEDIRDCVKLISPNDQFVTTDIKDGFYHIKVASDFRDYLGFKWKNHYFRWSVLPFGLSISPYYFNKTLRPIVSYLRSLGIRVSVFVDDFLLAATPSNIVDSTDQLLHTLSDLGFQINLEKSHLTPTSVIKYLGYVISSGRGTITVKAQASRISNLKRTIKRALVSGRLSARALARICGKCVSVAWAVTPGKLFLRNAYRLLSTRKSWSEIQILTREVIQEFSWWLDSVDTWNSREICPTSIQAQVITDASHLGWGAVCNKQVASGDWNKRISFQSSNEREMMAILMALKAFASILSGKRVQILTDNISAMAYVNHMGGPSLALSSLARAIWAEALSNGIWLESAHIAGCQNVEADFWSRSPDKHNWQLHPRLFSYINTIWGPHTIDRFANCQNAQIPCFNSRFWEPMSSGVDALAQTDWNIENNYVNPPFCLISRVLDIVESQKAFATIIAPLWKAQTWYQRLKRLSIDPPLKIPNSKNLYRSMGVETPEPCRNRKWQIYAWRVFGGKH